MYKKDIEDVENDRLYTYRTLKNNGHVDGTTLTGQCLWISICTALCHISDLSFTEVLSVKTLKSLASSNGACTNGDNEMFDFDKHSQSVINLCEIFNFCVGVCCVIQYSNNSSKYVNPYNPMFTKYYGNMNVNKERIVYIASYGAHFELIVEIGGKYTHYAFAMYCDDNEYDETQISSNTDVCVYEHVSVPNTPDPDPDLDLDPDSNPDVYIPIYDDTTDSETTPDPVIIPIDEQIKNAMETLNYTEQQIAKSIISSPELFVEALRHSIHHKKSFDVAMHILNLTGGTKQFRYRTKFYDENF